MREHPIPQDIVGYRFHIIGSMTLKQFAELAAGVMLGLIIYATNLPDVFKWPLVFLAVAVGAAAAFLPVAEQPLDHWLIAFFKSLYRPTKFFWQKSRHLPQPFLYEAGQDFSTEEQIDLTPLRQQRTKDYLSSVQSGPATSPLDQAEQMRLQEIMAAFEQVQLTDLEIEAVELKQKPQLKVIPRSLSKKQAQDSPDSKTDSDSTQQIAVAADKLAQEIEIPAQQKAKAKSQKESDEVKDAAPHTKSEASYVESGQATTQKNQNDQDSKTAVFNAALPFPSKPTTPNKLVGMILTPNQELIPDAIVEATDENGRVVRAVKTNALGQFFINTPLKEGAYTLQAEHERYQFQRQDIELENKPVEPIEIRSLS